MSLYVISTNKLKFHLLMKIVAKMLDNVIEVNFKHLMFLVLCSVCMNMFANNSGVQKVYGFQIFNKTFSILTVY